MRGQEAAELHEQTKDLEVNKPHEGSGVEASADADDILLGEQTP